MLVHLPCSTNRRAQKRTASDCGQASGQASEQARTWRCCALTPRPHFTESPISQSQKSCPQRILIALLEECNPDASNIVAACLSHRQRLVLAARLRHNEVEAVGPFAAVGLRVGHFAGPHAVVGGVQPAGLVVQPLEPGVTLCTRLTLRPHGT